MVFVITTIGLLAAYRYAIDTAANDWYLFQVARHTCWVLDCIGYRADLEKTTGNNLSPAEVRQFLRGGAPLEKDPARGANAAPLTPWEIWRYRSRKHRRDPGNTRVVGPQVVFVLSPGLQHRIQALESDLRGLPGGAHESADAGQAELNARIQALRAEMASAAGDPAQRRAQQGRFYSFIVIPDCGAIEVMAIFFAAVIAFPATWPSRAAGLAAGLPVMYLVNIFRLSCLACIGALDRSGEWFDFFHEYVWQAVYVIFVVVVWLAWVEYGVKKEAR